MAFENLNQQLDTIDSLLEQGPTENETQDAFLRRLEIAFTDAEAARCALTLEDVDEEYFEDVE